MKFITYKKIFIKKYNLISKTLTKLGLLIDHIKRTIHFLIRREIKV